MMKVLKARVAKFSGNFQYLEIETIWQYFSLNINFCRQQQSTISGAS